MPVDHERRRRFEALFAAHHAAVRSYVVRRAGGGIGVDDAVADTFLVAWRRLDEVPEPARPWLLGVTRRVLADQRRGLRRRRSLSARIAWEPPAGVSAELAGALRELTSREREALMLVAWDGLTPAEAAVAAGCSATAFRVRLHRARRRVAAQLGIEPATTNVTEKLT
jgi:DNA-directed RNA polymerase specialized sigma24 family protein